MNTASTFKIITEEQNIEFGHHLEIQDNDHILFSGKFGSGKTTFLKTYFSEREDQYAVIHLFPVNYSISSNKDIFELIKFDILWELIKNNGVKYEDFVFQKSQVFQNLIIHGSKQFDKTVFGVIKEIMGSISETGKAVSTGIGFLEKLFEEFNKYLEEINSSDLSKVRKYIDSFQEEKGGLYEHDMYTDFIIQGINQLQTAGKEVILIIDDLDRLDPDHIFRILNVFSARVDLAPYNRGEHKRFSNKFDLNRILLVCDIDNIRRIFSARYGLSTNFSGYIDKFYSKQVFHFSIASLASAAVLHILQSISLKNIGFYKPKVANYEVISFIDVLGNYSTSFVQLLGAQVQMGLISLRELLKLENIHYIIPTIKADNFPNKFDQLAWIYISFLMIIFNNDIDEIDNILNKSWKEDFNIDVDDLISLNSYLLGCLFALNRPDYNYKSSIGAPLNFYNRIETREFFLHLQGQYRHEHDNVIFRNTLDATITKIEDKSGQKIVLEPHQSSRDLYIKLNPFELLLLISQKYRDFGMLKR
ncbi:P-loop NTPase fold protein [Siphonobacter sp.]|uniref:P-loop NTPase fold protein n=1 Tax=Siphonobacter sp. TaxID=1869184 RepID=UPI003B3A282A